MPDTELVLPPKPEAPLNSDCCAGGCATCVLDSYYEELGRWQIECKRLREEWAAQHGGASPG